MEWVRENVWGLIFGVFGAILIIVLLGGGYYHDRFVRECNGHRELCNRRLNEIAIPMTHNAMSIADYDWFGPSHEHSITNQLESGVRGLMLDTHYFDAVESISSYFPDATVVQSTVIEKAIDKIGPEVRDGTYVCHILCQLGYTPLVETLTEVKTFLDNNSNEVVVIIFEDRIDKVDTVQAFAESGMDKYVYTHPGGQWPTLSELIGNNTRLVVMSEFNSTPPLWYPNAWELTEETPYSFDNPEEMSCDVNRGDTGKDFFLLNHWIEKVKPSREDAAIVNDYDFLLERARKCADERGFDIPNFVAVNFSEYGNLVEVVDELNGVSE